MRVHPVSFLGSSYAALLAMAQIDCWQDGFVPEVCCDTSYYGPEGFHACWDDTRNFSVCCPRRRRNNPHGAAMSEGNTMKLDVSGDGLDDLSQLPSKTTGGSQWWLDLTRKEAFTLFDLNAFYPDSYFYEHVNYDTAEEIVRRMVLIFSVLTGRMLNSIAEFGAAGGWFTRLFIAFGMDYHVVEGTSAGIHKLLQIPGIDVRRVHKADLRLPVSLPSPGEQTGRKFEMAMCTEVAEHIELPFLSQLVQTLTTYSDLIWFSFAPPARATPHFHHVSELPLRFWINMFDFYGYATLLLDAVDRERLYRRGRMLFYRRALQHTLIPNLAWLQLRTFRVPHTLRDVHILPSLFSCNIGDKVPDCFMDGTPGEPPKEVDNGGLPFT